MNERTKNPRESHSFAFKWDAIFGNPFMQAPRRSAKPPVDDDPRRLLTPPPIRKLSRPSKQAVMCRFHLS